MTTGYPKIFQQMTNGETCQNLDTYALKTTCRRGRSQGSRRLFISLLLFLTSGSFAAATLFGLCSNFSVCESVDVEFFTALQLKPNRCSLQGLEWGARGLVGEFSLGEGVSWVRISVHDLHWSSCVFEEDFFFFSNYKNFYFHWDQIKWCAFNVWKL